ncbi:NAD(P)/FAD-dependent oxidoreductase [Brevibacillus brevis]|uniref:NAD(P)/FAD-dependent oxidoreductase n=1 Tax=Brevibacillus brevis TaxID=1393 RepID=A0ABY9SWT0_BREBE|nr:NAD(P)/FAD-dependent oxidoreductase [Brevibacillus brevis]WNC12285.1 NAD(P)/FAD-dependent oxidoreductase [Brevibacillus brevis]
MTSIHQNSEKATDERSEFDAIVVGAGFSGLYMLYRLRELGLSIRVFDNADDVGGTWFWNRYPGARCDSESYNYCFSFSKELLQEWSWSERYATQPEILSYLKHVADRFDLRKDIQFNTRVTSAVFHEESGKWVVGTDRGDSMSAKFFINAVGCLSTANVPKFEGLESFAGNWYHTSKWPHEPVDFQGQKVGVIGTGASGLQCIPEIAKDAARLIVFQRTPHYASPAQNRPITPEEDRQIKANYDKLVEKMRNAHAGFPYETKAKHALGVTPEERNQIYEELWKIGGYHFLYSFSDLLYNKEANDTASEFIRSKIRQIVRDPEVAELLCPKEYPYGTKRPLLDWDYYETFNRENVSLVDIKKSPIVKITPEGIQTTQDLYELDSIVFATGFDAITGTLVRMDIRGRGGITLKQKWENGPSTYLGMTVHQFPNMFVITGPGSPSVLANLPITIEQGVDWITACIKFIYEHKIDRIEPTLEAENAWVEEVNKEANATLYSLASSWYSGTNIPGKPKVFMPYVGGLGKYRAICDNVAEAGYKGYDLVSKSHQV